MVHRPALGTVPSVRLSARLALGSGSSTKSAPRRAVFTGRGPCPLGRVAGTLPPAAASSECAARDRLQCVSLRSSLLQVGLVILRHPLPCQNPSGWQLGEAFAGLRAVRALSLPRGQGSLLTKGP